MAAAYQDRVIGFENNRQRTCEHCGWPIPKHEDTSADATTRDNGDSLRPGKYKIIM